ncbi:putative holin [Aeromonas sp. sif2433]|uniref:putative holin n=1 Tax=Aeromonas sp. sif2433 TaxID=2854794 RepID=UPI001C446F8B|nr:putative holin [Aeromonas sp. sif2433]MBV7413608.1 phage holin family protein [Aeromonas sp. sif2433]
MPEPISSSAATSALTGLILMLFTLPGVDTSVVLGAFTGALIFTSITDELGWLRKIALFIASFITGLLLAGLAGHLLANILPANVDVSNAVGAIIASTLTVKAFKTVILNMDNLFAVLFNKGRQS